MEKFFTERDSLLQKRVIHRKRRAREALAHSKRVRGIGFR